MFPGQQYNNPMARALVGPPGPNGGIVPPHMRTGMGYQPEILRQMGGGIGNGIGRPPGLPPTQMGGGGGPGVAMPNGGGMPPEPAFDQMPVAGISRPPGLPPTQMGPPPGGNTGIVPPHMRQAGGLPPTPMGPRMGQGGVRPLPPGGRPMPGAMPGAMGGMGGAMF